MDPESRAPKSQSESHMLKMRLKNFILFLILSLSLFLLYILSDLHWCHDHLHERVFYFSPPCHYFDIISTDAKYWITALWFGVLWYFLPPRQRADNPTIRVLIQRINTNAISLNGELLRREVI
jgi:hypothetical protein